MKEKIDLLQGTLDLLVLKALTLEAAGQRQLEAETEDWQRIAIAIASALKVT